MSHVLLKRGETYGFATVINLAGRFATVTTDYPPLAEMYAMFDKYGWSLHAAPIRGMDANAKKKYFTTFVHN